jgi:hypothetical protein
MAWVTNYGGFFKIVFQKFILRIFVVAKSVTFKKSSIIWTSLNCS